MSAAVAVMENLGVLKLPTQSGKFGHQMTLYSGWQFCKGFRWDILTALSITISDKDTPIAITKTTRQDGAKTYLLEARGIARNAAAGLWLHRLR